MTPDLTHIVCGGSGTGPQPAQDDTGEVVMSSQP